MFSSVSLSFLIDQWKFGFNKENSKEDTFHSKDGDEKTKFLIHNKIDNVKFFHDKENKVKVLSLPYKDEDFSMIFYLPTEKTSKVEKITELLEKISLESLTNQTVGPVQIPKFTMELLIDDLKGIMESLGAKDIWTGSANFKGRYVLQQLISYF